MPSRKTKHKTSPHSTPYVAHKIAPSSAAQCFASDFHSRVPPSSGRDTTISGPSMPYHVASTTLHNSHHNSASTYQALTPQVLHEHNHSQLHLHQNPTYFHTVHLQHTSQLVTGFNSLGVDLPDTVQSRVFGDPVGMTPLERFETHSTYPYHQYTSYQPVLSQQDNLQGEAHYADVIHQSEEQYNQQAPASFLARAASNSGSGQREMVYYAPQQEYYIPATIYGEATSPGNDLAAVGTQFNGHASSGYAQTF